MSYILICSKGSGFKNGLYEEPGDERNRDYLEEEDRNKAYGTNDEERTNAYSEYDERKIDKNDLIEELKLFKAVCDNIKYTLAEIKSYSKVTLMSDSKASYFTIVDAVLSGPKQINPDDLMSVLGVSTQYNELCFIVFITRSVTIPSQESKD